MAELGTTNSAQFAAAYGPGRALPARVAAAAGSFRLRGVRGEYRAGSRSRRNMRSCSPTRRAPRTSCPASTAAVALSDNSAGGDAGVPHREGRRVGRAVRLHRVRDRRSFLPRLPAAGSSGGICRLQAIEVEFSLSVRIVEGILEGPAAVVFKSELQFVAPFHPSD